MKTARKILDFLGIRTSAQYVGNIRLAIGNASWLAIAHILRWIAALFGGIFVARYLGPEQFGSYRFASAIVTICIPVWTLGLTSIVSKELVERRDAQNEILGTSLILRLFFSIVGSLLVVLGIRFLTDIDVEIVIFVGILSIGGCFSAFETIRSWFEVRAGARYFAPSQIVATYLTAAIKGLLVIAKAPLISFVIVASFELAIAGLAILIAFHHRNEKLGLFVFRTNVARRLLRHSWPLLLSGFASAIYLKIDQLMLGVLVSYEAAGIYAVAANISEMWYIFATILASSVFPFLLKLRNIDNNKYLVRLQQGYDILFVGALTLALAVTVMARTIIDLLYGAHYAPAAPVLMIHVWAGLFLFMREWFSKWLIIEGLYGYTLYTSIVGAILNIALNLILIPTMHEIGAAIATVISYAGAGLLSALMFSRTRGAGLMMVKAIISPLRIASRPRAYFLALRSGDARPNTSATPIKSARELGPS